MVEAIIGPCSREECEAAILVVQEALDERLPELAAATMGTFDVSDEPSRVVELEAQVAEVEQIARDFLAVIAAPAGRLSLTNPPPTASEVNRDADLIVRACRATRDALDATAAERGVS